MLRESEKDDNMFWLFRKKQEDISDEYRIGSLDD